MIRELWRHFSGGKESAYSAEKRISRPLMQRRISVVLPFGILRFAGNSFFFHHPFPQIDELAAFGTERLVFLFGRPRNRTLTGRTFYNNRLAACGHQNKQQVKANGTSSALCTGRFSSGEGAMKRMVHRCRPPLISAK